MRRIFLAGLFLVLAGCASVTPIDPGKTMAVGDGVSLTPDREWNQIKLGSILVWTIDGIGLDEVRIHTGLAMGRAIYPVMGMSDRLGRLSETMLPNDIQDLLVRTMSQEGLDNVRADDLTPCAFGGLTGFCFQTSFSDKAGLEMKGKAIAARNGKKLELIEFRAPADFYFDHAAPAVGQLFASISVH